MKKKGIILLFIVGILSIVSAIALLFTEISRISSGKGRNLTILTKVQFNLVTAFNETLKMLSTSENFGKQEFVKVLYLEDIPAYKPPPPFGSFTEFENWAKNIGGVIYGYKLKLEDTSVRINVNHPANANFSLKDSAKLILNNLGGVLQEYGFDVPDLGEKISLYKETLGRDIINLEELMTEEIVNVLGDTTQRKKKNFDILKKYVTTSSLEILVPATSKLNPQSYCDITVSSEKELTEYRPLINLNFAPREILFSILSGISGYVWEKGHSKLVKITDEKINMLLNIWEKEDVRFSNFLEFKQFLVKTNIFSPQEVGLILANLNPYSMYYCYNPDVSTFVDGFGYPHKYSMLSYTTEGLFTSSGIYSVDLESFAYYRGQILARDVKNSIMKLEEVFNVALVKDFEKVIDTKQSKNIFIYPYSKDFRFLAGTVKLTPIPSLTAGNIIDLEVRAKNFFNVYRKKNMLKDVAILPNNNELFIHENLIKPNNMTIDFDMKNINGLGFSFWIKPSWDGKEILGEKKVIARIFDYDVYYFQDGNFVADFGFVQAIKNVVNWKKGTWHYVVGWVGFSDNKFGLGAQGITYHLYVDGEPLKIIREAQSLEEILNGLNKVFKVSPVQLLSLLDNLWQSKNPILQRFQSFILDGSSLVTQKNLGVVVGSAISTYYMDSSLSNVKIGLTGEKLPMVPFYPSEGKMRFNVINDKTDCILNTDKLSVVYYLPPGWNIKSIYYLNDKSINTKSISFNKNDKFSIDLQFNTVNPTPVESPAVFQITAKCSFRSPSYVINKTD